LSYINDPIAIPYLVKLVQEKEELFAIEGLRRIGTDEAWEEMIVVTQSKYNKGAAAYAKAILRQKIPEIRNPNIRKKWRLLSYDRSLIFFGLREQALFIAFHLGPGRQFQHPNSSS
jgi:hypothetical protein